MKHLIFLIAMFTLPIFSGAQDFVDDLFSKHSGDSNFTSISISSSLLNFASFFDDNLDKLQDKVSDIQILISEHHRERNENFTNEIKENLDKYNYISLMEILSGKNKVNFYVKKEDEKIIHLILIANEDDEEVLLSLKGKFTLKELAELGKCSHDHGSFHYISYLKDIEN